MIVPTSWALTNLFSLTLPVSGSTSTSATWAMNEVDEPLRGTSVSTLTATGAPFALTTSAKPRGLPFFPLEENFPFL